MYWYIINSIIAIFAYCCYFTVERYIRLNDIHLPLLGNLKLRKKAQEIRMEKTNAKVKVAVLSTEEKLVNLAVRASDRNRDK